MNLQKTHSFRQINLVAVIAVAALIATACGGDDTTVEEPPTTTDVAMTTQPRVTPEATDELPLTPTTSAAMTEERIVEMQEEIAEVVEEASPDDVPPAEIVEQVIEAVEEAVPESVLSLGICTQWVADPEMGLNEQQAQECAAMLAAAVAACEGLNCFGDDGTEPEPEPEPEETPTTTAPPEPEEQITTSAPSQPEPETEEPTTSTTPPEPEPEQDEPTTTTTPPEPEPEDTQPEYSVGDVVAASELDPDRDDIPDNLFCEMREDGSWGCWTQPTETANPSNEGWVPPEAGMVPEPHPECSSDDPATWDQTCTPPSSWDWGEFTVGGRVDETPRLSDVVLNFRLGCSATSGAPCRWLMGMMKWPLDYLDARPTCVLNEYLDRVEEFARTGSAIGAVQDRHGWHNCATVIDPLVGETPEHGNDVGQRLSDTGLSLADRCRAVLPDDVMLETGYKLSGTPPTRFEPGHAGCDAWAEYVESSRLMTSRPDCLRARSLAKEWMEHYHGVHERYPATSC